MLDPDDEALVPSQIQMPVHPYQALWQAQASASPSLCACDRAGIRLALYRRREALMPCLREARFRKEHRTRPDGRRYGWSIVEKR